MSCFISRVLVGRAEDEVAGLGGEEGPAAYAVDIVSSFMEIIKNLTYLRRR